MRREVIQRIDTFVVEDKLKSDASGVLVTGDSKAPYFEVTKIVGNKIGVEATVAAVDPE